MRIVLSLCLLVLGLVIGVVGAFVQAQRYLLDTFPIPWGMVLSLVVLTIAIRGGVWLVMSRVGGWAVFAGWLIATVALAAETNSGDIALSGGGRQMTYLIAGVMLGAAAATIKVSVRPPTEQGTVAS